MMMADAGGVGKVLLFMLNCVFVSNFLYSRFPQVYQFPDGRCKIRAAAQMGGYLLALMALSSLCGWALHHLVLAPLGLAYLDTLGFVLIILALTYLLFALIGRSKPDLHEAMGAYLPMILTSCALLGVCVRNVNEDYDLLYSILNGLFGGLGFLIGIVLLTSVQERLELADTPDSLKGIPIALISAGLIAITFMGFSGIVR